MMSALIILVTLLSTTSVFASLAMLQHEAQGLQTVNQPFGGSLGDVAEQLARLAIAVFLCSLSLVAMGLSVVLIWLSLQTSLLG
jgi:hypothetical protein